MVLDFHAPQKRIQDPAKQLKCSILDVYPFQNASGPGNIMAANQKPSC